MLEIISINEFNTYIIYTHMHIYLTVFYKYKNSKLY